VLNFAVTGVGGYIAPRHLKAVHDTGNRLMAALDPHDAVGVLDRHAMDVRFFTDFERFDRHLSKLHRGPAEHRLHYLSVCSPNYLHDAHIRLALRLGANAICEKPLVINPWNLDALQELEQETGGRIYTVLQLRVHPALIALRERLASDTSGRRHQVVLTYVTARGPWYHVSWKGSVERSGGLPTNIGVHFFDLLIWLFGGVRRTEVHLREQTKAAGFIELERADARWFLSIDRNDLPLEGKSGGTTTFRSITVDGSELEFTDGFADLHTRVYSEVLAGRGFGVDDARPSIELVHQVRVNSLSANVDTMHPGAAREAGVLASIG